MASKFTPLLVILILSVIQATPIRNSQKSSIDPYDPSVTSPTNSVNGPQRINKETMPDIPQNPNQNPTPTSTNGLSALDNAKRAAAFAAVDKYITGDISVIGVGTGTTVKFVVERIQQIQQNLRKGNTPKEFVCVPSSERTKVLITESGLKLGDLDHYPEIDVCIDGADEVDKNMNAIKGGGGAHFQEKVLASASKKFIVVADYRKDSQVLGDQWKGGVPVEVVPLARSVVEKRLQALGYNPVLRQNSDQSPYITDNKNIIYDLKVRSVPNPKEMEAKLRSIPGILEVGLFCDMIERAYFASEQGTVSSRGRNGMEQQTPRMGNQNNRRNSF